MRRASLFLPAAAVFTLLTVPAALSAAAYSLQFYNFATSEPSSSFPYGTNNEIILASESANLHELLPIAIVIRIGNDRYKNAIPNNPELTCADEHHCSLPGPVIPASRQNEYLSLTASTSDGTVLATYTRGTPPPTAATPTPPSEVRLPSPAANNAATPAPTPVTAVEAEPSSPTPLAAPAPTATFSTSINKTAAPSSTANLILLVAALGLIATGAGLFFTAPSSSPAADPCAELRALLEINRRLLKEAQQDLDKARERHAAAQKRDSSYDKREAAKALRKAEALVEVIQEKIARLEEQLAACEQRTAEAEAKAAAEQAAAAATPGKDEPKPVPEEACQEGEEKFDDAETKTFRILDPDGEIVFATDRGLKGMGEAAEQFASWLRILKKIPGGKYSAPVKFLKRILETGADISEAIATFAGEASIIWIKIPILEVSVTCEWWQVCTHKKWVYQRREKKPRFVRDISEEYAEGVDPHPLRDPKDPNRVVQLKNFPEWLANKLKELNLDELPADPCRV